MRDASFILGRAGSRVLAVMLLAAATALGGCAGGGSGAANSYAMAPSGSSGATVAFESIDGPPPQVFDRMVGVLDSESKLRSLSVVSREGSAAYRVRSYLSAQIVRGKTVIAWVWDVYDANQQRALRLSGEEPTSAKAGRDAWGAADDLVLRKIAQAGFSGLSNMINGTPDAPGAAPNLRGPAVASVIKETPVPDMPASALGYAAQ
ncbi:hypothetical protein [Bradyrhizobium sp. CCGE-LA001]|uniref:hypothetical protein n=1 Tax=Bradyrhizobium sp. CCGE-LA001 TaxID=1223566 RepID=UPI000745BC5A|nr:hypothetical protein [Bradyrhizobium sp. CCGE-LA001]AMA55974.1 hypothetical protein BCCGELA001_06660 [Bradyrhizobium sp. CCGE-LA001]